MLLLLEKRRTPIRNAGLSRAAIPKPPVVIVPVQRPDVPIISRYTVLGPTRPAQPSFNKYEAKPTSPPIRWNGLMLGLPVPIGIFKPIPPISYEQPTGYWQAQPPPSGEAVNWSQLLADVITLTDALANTYTLNETDVITLTDAAAKTAALSKTDSITFVDILSDQIGVGLSDIITLTDATAKIVTLTKSDVITLTDALAKHYGISQADYIIFIDIVSNVIGVSIADAILLTDVINTTLSAGGGLFNLLGRFSLLGRRRKLDFRL